MASERIERLRKAFSRGEVLSMAALLTASGTATIGAIFSLSAVQQGPIAVGRPGTPQPPATADLSRLGKRVDGIEHAIRQASDNPNLAVQVLGLALLANKVDEVTKRQTKLETTLTDQPLKALEIPLLRRDIDSQAKEVAELSAALQRAQESQWETMRWLIGGLAAAIAAICIPIAGGFIAGRRGAAGKAE